MLKNIFRRQTKADFAIDAEQASLDALRWIYRDVPMMQLHCDRMQAALDAK